MFVKNNTVLCTAELAEADFLYSSNLRKTASDAGENGYLNIVGQLSAVNGGVLRTGLALHWCLTLWCFLRQEVAWFGVTSITRRAFLYCIIWCTTLCLHG